MAPRRTGRRALAVLLALVLLGHPAAAEPTFAPATGPALAPATLPAGGRFVAGTAAIEQEGGRLTVHQASEALIANWESFSIGEEASVLFEQPGASSVALNRVVGADPSRILGRLQANGRIFLVNPGGIVVGEGARIDTGGLVASTLELSDEDFLAGRYRFSANRGGGISGGVQMGGILNQGELSGPVVALIAPVVRNEGTIRGDAALAAGTDVALDFDGDGLLSVTVPTSTLATLVENASLIEADGGLVVLTAKGASAALTGVVNQTGVIEARTVAERGGRILLLGDMTHGDVHAGGRLAASFVETSAAEVDLDQALRVETDGGLWLLDPVDITIDADKASAVATALQSGDVTVSTENDADNPWGTNGTGTDAGDITVAAPIDWAGNTLTLRADRNIAINATLTSTGAAVDDGLVLQYAQTDASGDYVVNAPVNLAKGSLFRTQKGGDPPVTYTVITDLGTATSSGDDTLQGIIGNLSGNYVLGADIDASATSEWNTGEGFTPIGGNGNSGNKFTGDFDGLGHEITDLVINREWTDWVGLFGFVGAGGTVRNIELTGGTVTGLRYAGSLVGSNLGTVSNSHASGSVSSRSSWIGGLVGENQSGGTVANSSAAVAVTAGAHRVGGLVGSNEGMVTESYATGTVIGDGAYVGGLVGWNIGTVTHSSATGSVTGDTFVGGLVGRSMDGMVTNSYATGSVKGLGTFGADLWVGGLVGENLATVTSSYATGAVINTGIGAYGGLVGDNSGEVTDSYWDTQTTGIDDACGMSTGTCDATPLTTDAALSQASYGDFDNFADTWFIIEGSTRPMLRSEYSTTIRSVHQLQLMTMDVEANYTLAADIDFGDVFTDASRSDVWATSSDAGAGFVPIGNSGDQFTGVFDGRGHKISEFTIKREGVDYAGLFGYVGSGGTVRNVGLVGGSVTVDTQVVTGDRYIGGLVGANWGTVANSYATVDVAGESPVGGLVGQNWGMVTSSYAAGSVSGTTYVGGLVGENTSDGTVTNSYATGDVNSSLGTAGGLVGSNFGTVINSYATGDVASSSGSAGGLVGHNNDTVTNSYYLSGAQNNGVGTPLTAAQLQDPFTFFDDDPGEGWDLESVWGKSRTGENNGYMVLRALSETEYLYYVRFTGDATKTYGETEANASLKAVADLVGVNVEQAGLAFVRETGAGEHPYIDGNAVAFDFNVGSAADYYIDYGSGKLTVEQAVIAAVTGIAAKDKAYDGTTAATLDTSNAQFDGIIAGDSLSVAAATGHFDSKNAGDNLTVNISGIKLGGTSADNYKLTDDQATTTATINRVSLTVTANDAVKTYDGNLFSGGSVNYDGFVGSEDESVLSGELEFDGSSQAALNAGSYVITPTGLSSPNYEINFVSGALTVNPAVITAVNGIAARDKTYDGTTAAMLDTSGAQFAGTIDGDSLAVAGGTGHFATKDVGDDLAVSITGIKLGGSSAGNYTLADDTATAMATIARAPLTLPGLKVAPKAFDGNAQATVTDYGSLAGAVAGEDVHLDASRATASFADPWPGSGKPVTVTGLALAGLDVGNYVLQPVVSQATILGPEPISLFTLIFGPTVGFFANGDGGSIESAEAFVVCFAALDILGRRVGGCD